MKKIWISIVILFVAIIITLIPSLRQFWMGFYLRSIMGPGPVIIQPATS